ncbi:uncharacterized protein ColSpa_02751 [Colletotrichum spaethianum]|uniref:Uncharacterized protein n=1 Tax=Colletotrichum spaethianum TaxID=700344 RepID=A0AA37L9L1_9PEZI|nr:uncharacterized protein ColSpa_02751 [Colletotrichum spaethianum]GKT42570.1 hypothetical protein ColSpa_02751 [Colletotrichum spaethianum]
MARYAEYAAGCGKFSYEIQKFTPMALGEQKCFRADEFGNHKDVNPDFQNQYVGWACVGTALDQNKIRKGDTSSFVHFNTTTNGLPYQYNIYWAE